MSTAAALSLHDGDRFRPSAHVAARAIEDEIYFVHLDSGQYYSATGLGPALWQLLASGRSLGEVVATVAARYPEPAERIRGDVLAFARELLARELLVPCS